MNTLPSVWKTQHADTDYISKYVILVSSADFKMFAPLDPIDIKVYGDKDISIFYWKNSLLT